MAYREKAEREIQRIRDAGVIRPPSLPWCSTVVLGRKKDGSMRFCVDFRKTNNVTVKDSYPLQRIDAVLDTLSGATLFSTLDLQSGYWQCEVVPEDRCKTALSNGTGLYVRTFDDVGYSIHRVYCWMLLPEAKLKIWD